MTLAAVLLWNHPLLFPVKVFVVLLHEMGHATAAWLTGGEVLAIELSPQLGGACYSRGGIRLLVLPAGYLGSMVFGGLLLLAAARTRKDGHLSTALGLAVLIISGVLVRSGFGLIFGLAFGSALVAAGRFLGDEVNDLVLRFLGLCSCLYALVDIKEDLIVRTVPGSDAHAMSEELFLPPVFWGVTWGLLAVIAAWFFLRLTLRWKR